MYQSFLPKKWVEVNDLPNGQYSVTKNIRFRKEAYERLIEMSKNDDFTTGNILDYLYHQNY